MTHTPTVYLAGPITGLSYGGATDWRHDVIAQLAPDIKGLSPMRAKQYLAKEDKIGDSYENTALSSQAGITGRDRFDCRRADLAIFNFLGADKTSIGTCIEVGWTDAYHVPGILVIEASGNVHDHAMIRQICPWRVHSLDAAVTIAKAVLL